MSIKPEPFAFGTKAETLERLVPRVTRCTVPEFLYFSMAEWLHPSSPGNQIFAREVGALFRQSPPVGS